MAYLDPKNHIVFKKIFGDHVHLLKSFLNSVLPLPEDGLIEDLSYLPSDQVPPIPGFKYTVVDVRCVDRQGRIFIVEMQIQWTKGFMQRMLFNSGRAYVNQLEKGEGYELLRPVYGLALLNTEFDPDPAHWYHHYKIVNVKKPAAEIKDLQLIFIELPKFKAQNLKEKKLQVLWLRFMAEISDKTRQVSSDFLEVPEIKEAVALVEEAAYSPTELAGYDKCWDAISIEKTLLSGALEKGREQGRKEGRKEGIEEGRHYEVLRIAEKLLEKGATFAEVAEVTGLSLEVLQELRK